MSYGQKLFQVQFVQVSSGYLPSIKVHFSFKPHLSTHLSGLHIM